MRTHYTTFLVAATLVHVIPSVRASAQVVPIVVEAAPMVARATQVIRQFLTSYAAGKGVDFLMDDGAGVRDSITSIRDRLRTQASINAANRQVLLRQATLLDGLRSDLGILLSRRPAAAEAIGIDARTGRAIAELQSIQTDHERRIGRLEMGQDSLRRLLAAFALSNDPATLPRSGPSSPDVPRNAKCATSGTGQYGFANKFNKTPVSVSLDVAGRTRTISVQVGQTQYFYDVPAGPHDYRVQFQAMRPLMPFPPGAPLVETTVTFAEGQVLVEACKSPVYEIKNNP